jgi:putative FmdB family regulatory protein
MLQRSIRRLLELPLYEYECPKDGLFERIQKFSDPPLDACPTCGGPIEKLLSAPAIQFKGSGWYITDYARKSSGVEGSKEGKDKAAAKESSRESSSSASSAESKGSTPETKSGSTEAKSSTPSGDKK